ncbi:MAG: VWA domain-containing protein [Solitalea sp.]
MDLSLVFNSVSPWWTLPCILAGVLYAWLLYRKESHFPPFLRGALGTGRAIAVALIAFLLLAPLFKDISRTLEKPIVVIAQDNSASILLDEKNRDWYTRELPLRLEELQKQLEETYHVQLYHFGEHVESGNRLDFSEKQTDISLLVQELKTRFAGRNLGAVILLSDGIYNKGSNPLYELQGLDAPFYTIALGDTIPQKDLVLASADHNQVVFLENDFRIEVHAEAIGAEGATTRLRIQHDGHTVFSETIRITEPDFRVQVPVDLTATETGRQKYVIDLEPVEGELTEKNNSIITFIDVLDTRQKILVLAEAPHPDLGALKQALERREQYEVDIQLASGDLNQLETQPYSLIILHQLPSARHGIPAFLQTIQEQNLPVWFIVGNQTNLAALGQAQQTIRFARFGGNYNEVFPVTDPAFYLFTLPEESRNRFAALPPLSSPFCEIVPQSPLVTLFSQRIGTVETGQPLLSFSTQGNSRSAWLFGEGLWRWRLHDFRLHGDQQAVDDLLIKTVQYLATREDTRRFRVSTPQSIFSENEAVTFTAELYNESYEAITSPDIRMTIRDEQGNTFPFLFSKGAGRYHLDAGLLPVGEYTYTASVEVGGQESTASGSFVVHAQNAEELQTTANHQLLYGMAEKSGGQLLYPDDILRLGGLLSEKETISPLLYEEERYEELINFKWLFFLLLTLLSAEWFIRKRNGLY